jgi:6-pyruvoyltetrahydropterin/6-carboxytetrahydropterin synthase
MLRTKASFDSAHFLWGYEGKCRNIHGHRWTVEIEVYDNQLIENGQEKGMVVDFGSLKKDLKGIADNLDHCLIIEKGSL